MSKATPAARAARAPAAGALMRLAVCAAPLALVAGCAAFPTLSTAVVARDRTAAQTEVDGAAPSLENSAQPTSVTTLEIPSSVVATEPRREPASEAQIDALVGVETVDAALAPQSIPQFVSTVFGGVLGLPFVISPDVASRTDIISGGTGGSISKRNLFRLTQLALRQYGVEVYIEGGLVTIGTSATDGAGTAILRSRATPEAGGRVVQFFTVQTIDVNVLQSLLQDLFPNLGNARITPDPLSNGLLISGPRQGSRPSRPRFAGD